MASMFPVYDEKAWKALLASVEADTAYTAASTFFAYVPNATGAMSGVQGTATNAAYLIFVAHEPPKERIHMMFSYVAT